jgi:hypothetical protein
MDKQSFLLKLLAGIFMFQASIFTIGVVYCARHGGIKECPTIGQRYEQTFNVAIATTLALLTGSAITKN